MIAHRTPTTRSAVTLGLLALLVSCGTQPGGLAVADYTPRQREILSLAPAGAFFGLILADPEHTLARLQAFRGVAESGPVGKKYIEQGLDAAKQELGFDLSDAQAWRQQGIDVGQPMGLFMLDEDKALLLLVPTDAARAKATIEKVLEKNGKSSVRCNSQGKWLACADPGFVPAGAATSSLWPRIAKEVPARPLSGEIGLFLALDQGPAAKGLRENKSNADASDQYFAHSKSLFTGVSLGEQQIVANGFYANPDSDRLVKYLQPEPGTRSLLGAGADAHGLGRMYVSARQLWTLARQDLEKSTLDQVTGGFMMATGLDLEKDVVSNLTGEMLFLNYGYGKGRPLTGLGWSGLGGAWLLGTRDDATTRRVAERLDALASGGLASVQSALDATGWKIRHTTDTVAGRPCYSYSMDVPPDQTSQVGFDHLTVEMTTVPGGLVLGFDRASIEKLAAGVGKSPEAFLGQLLTPEARRAFESKAPLVIWGLSENPLSGMGKDKWDAMLGDWSRIHPDVPEAFKEYVTLSELLYDGTMTFDVGNEGLSFLYQLTLM